MRGMVFLDFDGTIARCDVVDAVLERYADRAWTNVEDAWRAGRIGSRECLRDQMALVRAAPAELDELLSGIGLDEGFANLVETCASHAMPVHIVSDGFDYCIERILGAAPAHVRELVRRMRVCASHLEPAGASTWRVGFPHDEQVCEHGCATCKPAVMAELNPSGAPAVFVGDGLSDRFAARTADLVFAKQKLAVYCREQSLAHVEYTTLDDVANELDRIMRRGGIVGPATIAVNR